tara:strand:+ start:144 stop:290 length:147 start_codon:yes stop_codon:yes gene_type:complete
MSIILEVDVIPDSNKVLIVNWMKGSKPPSSSPGAYSKKVYVNSSVSLS